MLGLKNLFTKKPYLAWYVRNIKELSESSMLEHILNYGDWDDYLEAERLMGIKNVAAIFSSLKKRARTNLKPKTINYFEKYFQKYA